MTTYCWEIRKQILMESPKVELHTEFVVAPTIKEVWKHLERDLNDERIEIKVIHQVCPVIAVLKPESK